MDYGGRQAEFRRRLDVAGLDAYWVVSAANVRYLCGFPGEDSTLLVTAGRAVLITDSRYVEQAERQARVDEVVSRHRPMAQTAAGLCKALSLKKIGVTSANLSHAQFSAAAAAAEPARLVARPDGIAEAMRARKDADEVAAIRRALAVAEAAFEALLPCLEPGRSERWLAARLEYEMRTRGADGASFDIICAVGAHASMPHAVSGEEVTEMGVPVLFDWGARLEGYCCDLTRVVGTGTISPHLASLADVVLASQEAVFDRLRPGTRCSDADAAGRAVVAKAGFGACFSHGIGHGVGLAVHEGPRLAPGDGTVLLPGMVVTVEPGIYLPGRAGVRIEEMVLITPEGREVLTRLPRRPGELPSPKR